tara:strand:+ start:290 stop:676 length:387 start_codon:yes stop_codon:yes gene_type:complete
MFQRKPRRFRRRPNGRSHISHGGINDKTRLRNNSFSDGQPRNNFRTFLSAEKLFEKYSSLAKEAMSSGDKILSENYLQHADHFIRVIEDKNRNRNQIKDNVVSKPIEDGKSLSVDGTIDQNNNNKVKN